MSEGAAIVGILLVGFGFWWGDAAAAAFISLEVVRDGWHNVRQVIGDLMDESPTKLGKHDLESLPEKLKAAAEALPWVQAAGVRLREQGHVVTGVVFVVPRPGVAGSLDLVAEIDQASTTLRAIDWRLHDIAIMPVPALEQDSPPVVSSVRPRAALVAAT
jgi:divalent metal cation (Fe/Co/Zn/Cd) transporter